MGSFRSSATGATVPARTLRSSAYQPPVLDRRVWGAGRGFEEISGARRRAGACRRRPAASPGERSSARVPAVGCRHPKCRCIETHGRCDRGCGDRTPSASKGEGSPCSPASSRRPAIVRSSSGRGSSEERPCWVMDVPWPQQRRNSPSPGGAGLSGKSETVVQHATHAQNACLDPEPCGAQESPLKDSARMLERNSVSATGREDSDGHRSPLRAAGLKVRVQRCKKCKDS